MRDDSDRVTTLTLNRPDKLNALDPATFVELRAHLDALGTDERVDCVVLTGAGRSFSAGHDLGSIASGEAAPSRNFEAETIDRAGTTPAADDRQDPGSLPDRRARARPRLRPARRHVVGPVRRHPRAVGARPDVGHVDAAARAGRAVDGEGADVHEPTGRWRDGGLDRPRRPSGARRRPRRRRRARLAREIVANSAGTNRICKALLAMRGIDEPRRRRSPSNAPCRSGDRRTRASEWAGSEAGVPSKTAAARSGVTSDTRSPSVRQRFDGGGRRGGRSPAVDDGGVQ